MTGAVLATLSDWLLVLHVLGAMVWLGGLVVLAVLSTVALRRSDGDVGRFVGSLRVVGPLALAPSVALVLAFGIWLVVDSSAWSFGQTWLVVALALFACAFLVGAAFMGRTAIAAERAAAAGDSARASQLLQRWSWGVRLVVVLLVAVTADMVVKPGL